MHMNVLQGIATPAATLTETVLNGKNPADRIKCRSEQIKVLEFGQRQATVATVAVGGATLAAMKSKAVNNIVNKALQSAKNVITKFKGGETFKKALPTLQKFANKFKVLPNSAKAIAAAGVAVAGIATHLINHKTSFKQGQIEQKYNDKAAIAKEASDVIK